MTRMPASLHSWMEPVTSLRGGSSMPTQPTKVRSHCGRRTGVRRCSQAPSSHPCECVCVCVSLHSCPPPHLIIGKLGGVLQDHLLGLQGVVTGGQGQATQGVATGSPVLDHGQDLVLDGIGQWHAGGANSHVGAPVNHTLWGTLLEEAGLTKTWSPNTHIHSDKHSMFTKPSCVLSHTVVE